MSSHSGFMHRCYNTARALIMSRLGSEQAAILPFVNAATHCPYSTSLSPYRHVALNDTLPHCPPTDMYPWMIYSNTIHYLNQWPQTRRIRWKFFSHTGIILILDRAVEIIAFNSAAIGVKWNIIEAINWIYKSARKTVTTITTFVSNLAEFHRIKL